MLIALGKRSRFAHQRTRETQPVEKRAAIHIEILPEQILVEITGSTRIATNGELHSGSKAYAAASKVQNRINARVEDGVVGISILNQQLTRNGKAAAGIAFFHQTGDGRPARKMQPVT